YRELEELFNRQLAGRFPFSPQSARPSAEAEPAALRAFFKLFDTYNPEILKFLDHQPDRSPSGQQMMEFLDQMANVREFFAPFLADAKSTAPAFDFDADFRVNTRREVGGSQIIDWALEVGNQQINARDPQRRGRWVLGTPIRV